MEALQKFDDLISEKGVDLPKEANTALKLRMLHGFKFDYEKALVKLQDCLKFEEEFLPPKLGE